MKILDRYIIASFVKNYLISFMVLVGLYVVLDMLFNFDELLETREAMGTRGLLTVVNVIADAIDYYSYQIVWYYVQLAGVIPVVAAAFTLVRFIRFNELSAMMSAGVPLLRIASPIILTALALNGILILDQELLIPNVIPKLMRSHDDVRGQEKNSFSVPIIQDEQGTYLNAERYFPAANPPSLRAVSIIETSDGLPRRLVTAERADWDSAAGAWRLTGGWEVDGILGGEVKEAPVAHYRTSIDPERILLTRRSQFVSMLSSKHINELIAETRKHPDSGSRTELLRTKHVRFTQPLVNMILLMLGIGAVLTRDPQQIKSGATRCVMLCAACLAMSFVGYRLAGTPPASIGWQDAWPALMAWLPVFIFGPVAVWMLDRVKT